VLFAVNRGISVIAKDRHLSPARDLIAMADALIASLTPKQEPPAQQPLPAPAKPPSSRLGRLFGGG
jgi:hypothetical protein